MDDAAIIKQLQQENQRLRKELEYLRSIHADGNGSKVDSSISSPAEQLSPHSKAQACSSFHVTNDSTPAEKIALFTSLFKGRSDVYARRWTNAQRGYSGYSPVCNNFWKIKICGKSTKKWKCPDCKYTDYKPLTAAIIMQHLKLTATEQDVVGIYPLLEDNSTWFLAVDFDGDSWQSDSYAFSSTAKSYGFDTAVERSRSSNGAHVWLFFEQAIPARTARKLGSSLLTIAMDEHSSLKFTSYDRFFPSQDILPKGGLGNLIALPLQGFARNSGGSVFLDDSGQIYEDQWSYLSSVAKISADNIDTFLTRFGKNETLGALSPLGNPKAESDSKPWDKQGKEHPLTSDDFPTQLEIAKANMIHIAKAGISARALNRLRRLAAFSNPAYYEKQRLRLYIPVGFQRIIDASEEDSEYLSLPRGCEAELTSLLDEASINYELLDKTEFGTPLQVSFARKLRSDQMRASNALLKHPIGVLSAATAFGKTVVAADIIAKRGVSTLILVHTTQLMEQWIKSLEKSLNFDEELVAPLETTKTGRTRKALKIGYLQGAKNRLTGRVDVAMASSLLDKDGKLKSEVRAQDYGLVIVDECHHAAAYTLEMVLRQVHARYVYGLSATPDRKDGLQPLVFMHCGPIRHTVSEKQQNEQRGFIHQVIPRFTNLELPDAYNDKPEITHVFTAIADNEERNAQMSADILTALDSGRTPLVLTKTVRQAKHLVETLTLHCENVIMLTGGLKSTKKKQVTKKLTEIHDDEPMVLVATGQFVGEGFDFPRLDTLFIATPVSWKGLLQQYVGRLNREYSNKQVLQIYDYIDIGIQSAESMYFKRLKHYKSQNYQILSGEEQSITDTRCVFDGKEFWEPLFSSISEARKEVIISCTRIHVPSVRRAIKSMKSASIKSSVKITIITSPLLDYPIEKQSAVEELHQLLTSLPNAVLITGQAPQSNFVVIDRKKVWFGNVSPLGYASVRQSIMHFVSREVAERLLSSVGQ